MTKPLNLVIFSANYLPNIGGVERFTEGLAFGLRRLGHRVTIVTNNTFKLAGYEELCSGVSIVRLPCFPFLHGRLPFPNTNSEFRKLFEQLMGEPCDGVLINTRFYIHTLFGLKFASKKAIAPVLLDHGSAHLTFGNAFLDMFVQLYEHYITAIVKRCNPEFYGISQKSVEWLEHFGIKARGVIGNSIDAAAYRARASNRSFRSELHIGGELMLAFTGRFIPEKGIATLVDIMRRLQGERVHLVMAGDGPLRSMVEDAKLEAVHFVGRLDAPDIAALLLESDLFCLPTRSEGFSTSLLEAAACGTPSLVTDVGGARELMPDESYGFVMPSADGPGFAAVVRNVLQGLYDLSSMGDRCRRRVEERYSWTSSAHQLIEAMHLVDH